jgi:transcriptional regulator with XRE-family HTH domain
MASKKPDTRNADLKWAIFNSGQTQRALAKRLHMDETRLSRLVQGQAQPFPEEREALSKALGFREDALFRPRKIA